MDPEQEVLETVMWACMAFAGMLALLTIALFAEHAASIWALVTVFFVARAGWGFYNLYKSDS